jgi:hypothetical protein
MRRAGMQYMHACAASAAADKLTISPEVVKASFSRPLRCLTLLMAWLACLPCPLDPAVPYPLLGENTLVLSDVLCVAPNERGQPCLMCRQAVLPRPLPLLLACSMHGCYPPPPPRPPRPHSSSLCWSFKC